MSRQITVLRIAGLLVFAGPTALAQSGAFIVTLGIDTVQAERFTRTGDRVEGLLVLRTPTTVRVSYALTLDAAGRMTKYEQSLTDGNGAPLASALAPSTMTVGGDSIFRESGPQDQRVVARAAAPGGAFPLGTIPVGTPFGIWELAVAGLRGREITPTLTVDRVQAAGNRLFVSRTPVLYSGADSLEMDYFGQGRAGFRFDGNGRLIRSDWRSTTYAILAKRVERVDVEALARAWTAQDQRGQGFGRLSGRDTVRATVGGANLQVEYSRPSKRGREIWGALVPWDRVWRLGADQATGFRTDANIMIGETAIPAGSYTLWMHVGRERSELIVSSLVNVFGTQYNPQRDFARIPLRRSGAAAPIERFTIGFREGALVIEWDASSYSVPLTAPP